MNRRTFLLSALGVAGYVVLGAEKAMAVEVGRIYICPVVTWEAEPGLTLQTAYFDPEYTRDVLGIEGVRRCRNAIATISTGDQRGKPAYNWSLSYVEMQDGVPWTAIDAEAAKPQLNIVRLDGDSSLDNPMTANKLNDIRQAGAMTQQEQNVLPNTTFRTVLTFLLQKHNGPLATIENQFPEIVS